MNEQIQTSMHVKLVLCIMLVLSIGHQFLLFNLFGQFM